MNNIVELLTLAVIAVAGFTAIYRMMPLKKFTANKPGLTFFPKYTATFDQSPDAIASTLVAQGFKKEKDGRYSRGKIYGDFSAKAIKLSVVINAQVKEITVCASFFGILFDTGDIWQVTSDILNDKNVN